MKYRALVTFSYEFEFDEDESNDSLVLQDQAFEAAMEMIPNQNYLDASVSHIEPIGPSQSNT